MREETTVGNFVEERADFQELIDLAEGSAQTEYEMEFVTNLVSRFEKYGMTTVLTQRQYDFLQKLADR